MNRIAGSALVLAAVFAALTASVSAQIFPERQVKIIVPTAPGGAIDATARIIGEKMQARWGKPVVIENRAGASMRIGAEAVQKARADGYTLLVAHDGTMAINPLVFPDLPYDPQKDFVPLGLVASIPEA
jgi:tripartite-type tricarboxylate transporter receptor subunit TctC